jgi:diguanylate cyclase (GGDEF)-like protein
MSVQADFGAFTDFNHAADEIMASMNALLGLEYWLVTRVTGDDWVVLRTFGPGPYAVGQALAYSSTICSHMIAGRGPHIVNDVARNEHYAAALIRSTHAIASYAGAPLMVDGQVYGVLCALDPATREVEIAAHERLIVTSARTLSTILTHELEAEELMRRVERAEAEALVDPLTGLFNRRGWDRLLEREARRAQRYGNQATMFLMDIDGLKEVNDSAGHGAGDALIKRVAEAITRVMREHDIAARLGGDEFGVLAVETSVLDAQLLNDRFDAAFTEAGVRVSIGRAHCNRNGGLTGALAAADELMYLQKSHRHERRAARPTNW